MESKFYKLSAKSITGEEVSMKAYEGKVILVVNTASKCGFTPQYGGLEKLYKKYKDQGLVVLGFPCNQFANQEPEDEKWIKQNCLVNYDVSFQMFSKVDVNGKNAHPIFKYLKNELSGFLGRRIKWNFTKFIIDRDGKPLKRFAPNIKPENIEPFLKTLLS